MECGILMFESIAVVENSGNAAIGVCFEPWGMTHQLTPGQTFRVVATSTIEGQLEIAKGTDLIAVYGWQGSTIRVFRGEALVGAFSTPVPELPPRQTVRSFIETMFGGPGEPR